MNDFSTNPASIEPELLSAILARFSKENPGNPENFKKLLSKLPTDKQALITQLISAYKAKFDEKKKVNPGDAIRFTLHSAAEALQPQPPIDWIVKPLFSSGTVSMVMGDPGSKKTYALIDLAVCLSLGKSWLDFESKQISVLIVDEESGIRRTNRRMGDIMRGHDAGSKIPLYYISLARFDFRLNGSDNSRDLKMLEEKIQETKAKLIIIDALADVMPGADENSVKDVQPIFMGLRQVADRTESAIVVIHHSNRGGKYRGSSAILGALDLLIKVESKRDSPNIDFTVEKNRDDKPVKFAAVAHFEKDKFFLTPSISTQKQEFGKPQKYVLRYLRNNGASSMSDIMEHADSCAGNSARQAVYFLADQELVFRADDGGSGVKSTYDLTEKGKEKLKTLI